RVPGGQDANLRSGAPDSGAGPARVLDRELGGCLSEDARAARAIRRIEADRELRAAARLLVQPRWFDDVLHLRDVVHRAGLRHRAWLLAAAVNASAATGH